MKELEAGDLFVAAPFHALPRCKPMDYLDFVLFPGTWTDLSLRKDLR
jgi:hypothetical protein